MNHEQWGIRSLVTGRVYAWGCTQDYAEILWAGTGTPSRYEVVHLVQERWAVITPKTQPPDATMVPGTIDVADLVLQRIAEALRQC